MNNKQIEDELLKALGLPPNKSTLEYDILYGTNEIDKNSLEYELLQSMEKDSWWLKEMKKEHNFFELCRCLEDASFERACPTCYWNQEKLGKNYHGRL